MEIIDLVGLFFTGVFGGFLAGLLGIGGSPVYVFAFTIFIANKYGDLLSASEQVKMVIANTSFAKIFAAMAGLFKHWRDDNLYILPVLLLAIPAGFIAIGLSHYLNSIHYSKESFSIIFILLLIPLLLRLLWKPKVEERDINEVVYSKFSMMVIGGIAGAIAALTGLGGGVVIVPLLNTHFKIDIRQVVSISLGVIFCIALVVTIYYWQMFDLPENLPYTYGGISLPLCLPMVAGVLLAAPLGVRMSYLLSPRVIRILFVLVCLIIIGKTIIVDLL